MTACKARTLGYDPATHRGVMKRKSKSYHAGRRPARADYQWRMSFKITRKKEQKRALTRQSQEPYAGYFLSVFFFVHQAFPLPAGH